MNYREMTDDELARALKEYAEQRSGEIANITYAASLRISVLSARAKLADKEQEE